MKVLVTLVETKKTIRTYCVNGVNSLEAAEKCARRCYNKAYQPNTHEVTLSSDDVHCWRSYDTAPTLEVEGYEVVEV